MKTKEDLFLNTKKMKLIKLTNDHYIICDDSEIKEGDYHFDFDKNEIDTWKGNLYSNRLKCKKIIHSTQPLECDKLWTPVNGKQWMCNTMLCCGKILNPKTKPISLQEVKELIGEVDVDKNYVLNRLCAHNKRNPDYIPYDEDDESRKPTNCYCDNCFYGRTILSEKILQLNQALEDNKEKKYTEEDLRKAYMYGDNYHKYTVGNAQKYTFESLIQHLQFKTEWDVEFVDGKLKLK